MNGRFPNKVMTALVAAAALVFVAVYPASASRSSMTFHGDEVVNVSVNFSSQTPLPDLSDETLAAKQKAGRVYLYELARDECEVLTTVIAESCRLTNLSVNSQIQRHNPNNPPMLYLNGSANFAISLKKSETP